MRDVLPPEADQWALIDSNLINLSEVLKILTALQPGIHTYEIHILKPYGIRYEDHLTPARLYVYLDSQPDIFGQRCRLQADDYKRQSICVNVFDCQFKFQLHLTICSAIVHT